VQAELGEAFGVSQPTISRAVTGLTPVLGRVLASYVPVAEDLDARSQYIVDGTLQPQIFSMLRRPDTSHVCNDSNPSSGGSSVSPSVTSAYVT